LTEIFQFAELTIAKKSYSVIMSLRNIPSMQHYVLLILRHSCLARKKVFAFFALTRECRKIIQHTRNVATAQN